MCYARSHTYIGPMRTPEFIGLGLIVVGLFHVIPALVTGKIPARWPIAPLRKDNKPDQYKTTFAVFVTAIIGGAILVTASLLVRLVG